MIIINQDRDRSYQLFNKGQLHIGISTYNNSVIGFNILFEKEEIGTFDTLLEALNEMNNICNCTYDYYIVSGFTDYLECFGG